MSWQIPRSELAKFSRAPVKINLKIAHLLGPSSGMSALSHFWNHLAKEPTRGQWGGWKGHCSIGWLFLSENAVMCVCLFFQGVRRSQTKTTHQCQCSLCSCRGGTPPQRWRFHSWHYTSVPSLSTEHLWLNAIFTTASLTIVPLLLVLLLIIKLRSCLDQVIRCYLLWDFMLDSENLRCTLWTCWRLREMSRHNLLFECAW